MDGRRRSLRPRARQLTGCNSMEGHLTTRCLFLFFRFFLSPNKVFRFAPRLCLCSAKLFFQEELSPKIIKSDIGIVHSKGVQQIQYRLGHHRRSAEAERRPAYREERPPPRRAYSVMLLEAEHRPAYREERPPPRRAYILRSRSLPRAVGAHSPHPAWHTPRTPPAPMR